ncbi:MAG: DNA repair protein RecO [Eggerthellaceae bacterium]|nr:DNA repair protein RecO [Eggerthellaceae bacterium]
MAAPSYPARGLVLRKTKLGESDLVVTMLAQDGSQLRAVAKGARKPTSTFASRLELYAEADLLCSPGRSLDVVREARLVRANAGLRSSVERAAAAAPAAELLARVSQPDLPQPRLYDASAAGLAALDGASPAQAPGVCAALLLKTLGLAGLRPSLARCVCCGEEAGEGAPGEPVPFSFSEGGVVCAACRPRADAVAVDAGTVAWARFLLGSTYAAILDADPDPGAAFGVLRLCQGLVRAHVGGSLRGLEFLFTCGLFGDEG